MANVQVGDRCLVTVTGSLLGQRTMSTFLYRISAVTGDVEYNAAMAALASSLQGAGQVYPRYKACCPSNWVSSAIWCQIIRPLRYRKTQTLVTGFGGMVAVAHTANVQASVTRAGEFAGRKYIGGVRVPIGTDDVSTDGGFITAAQLAALNDLAAAMQLNIITSGAIATYIPQVGVPKLPDQSADLKFAFPQETTRVLRRRTVGLGI